jgi:hypothetical protein
MDYVDYIAQSGQAIVYVCVTVVVLLVAAMMYAESGRNG